MIYKSDLQEMQLHTIQHYYKRIVQEAENDKHETVMHMITSLSTPQKEDFMDWIDKKFPINPSSDQMITINYLSNLIQTLL